MSLHVTVGPITIRLLLDPSLAREDDDEEVEDEDDHGDEEDEERDSKAPDMSIAQHEDVVRGLRNDLIRLREENARIQGRITEILRERSTAQAAAKAAEREAGAAERAKALAQEELARAREASPSEQLRLANVKLVARVQELEQEAFRKRFENGQMLNDLRDKVSRLERDLAKAKKEAELGQVALAVVNARDAKPEDKPLTDFPIISAAIDRAAAMATETVKEEPDA